MSMLSRRTLFTWSLVIAMLFAAGAVGTAGRWVGKSFPGFMTLDNGVVASVGLPGWSGRDFYQHRVVKVDGRPIEGGRDVLRVVRSVPSGTVLAFEMRRGEDSIQRDIRTREFTWSDFWLLFGAYLLNGLVLGGSGILLFAQRRFDPIVGAAVPLMAVGSCWGLTALDLYGPYDLFRLHAFSEAMLFAAILHLASFSSADRFTDSAKDLMRPVWALAVGLAVAYQFVLDEPLAYSRIHLLATSAMGGALVVLLVSLARRALEGRRSPSSAALLRRKIAAGAVVALLAPCLLTAGELMTGGALPQNAVAFTGFIFPLWLTVSVNSVRGADEFTRPVGVRPSG